MTVNKAILQSAGSVPEVEIIVGFAHFAKYEFFLYDANGQNPARFADGVTSDDVPDIFPVDNPASVQALNKRTMFWQAAIASPSGSHDDKYSVLIRVMQDGKIVGTDTKTGLMTDPLPFGFIRFSVV